MPSIEDFQRWYGPSPLPEPAVLHARAEDDNIVLAISGTESQGKDIMVKLQHLTAKPVFRKAKYDNAPHVPLTWAVVTQCARLAEQHQFKWRPDESLTAWIVDEFTRRFEEYKDPGDLKFNLSSLDREPMPHQAAGAYLGALNKRMFFADAAGTGKTMTALLTLAEMDARGMDPFPAFVVTPASVVDPWIEELQACFPRWMFDPYRGPRRRKLSSRYQVYVMSWDVFRQDMQVPDLGQCPNGHGRIEWKTRDQKELDKHLLGQASVPQRCTSCADVMLPIGEDKDALPPLITFLDPKGKPPRTLILDEAHALCNTKTKQSQAAEKIARVVEHIFLMSGTPITNDIGGFWRAHSVIDTRSFPSQDRYKERYTDRFTGQHGPEVEGLTSVNRDEFYTVLQGTMRRVSKKDVLKDLPDKTYSTRVVELPPHYMAAYREMEEDMIAHIPDTDEPLPVMNTLAQLQRLTQLASSACDVEIEYVLDENKDSFTFGEEVAHYKVTMREPSWKVDELMTIMAESVGEPIITAAPHAQLMTLAGKRAEKEGYRVGYIKGGQAAKARTAVREAFQGNELDLLCVTTSAGGVGLTLTAAHTMVMLERPWAYWQADQMEDRIHRRGQSGQVSIIDIIARNTVEYRVREALKDKAQQLSDLIRDPHIMRNFLGGK